MAKNTRRDFVKQSVLSAAAFLAYPPARVLGANDRVRVGMIGVGGRGQELLNQVSELRDIQLVAIADIYSRRREEAKKAAPGILTLDDHRRLLDMKDVDGVIVASPLHIHARHFMDTLAAGKDLYAEKTMTWSIPEADQCLQAAKKSDRVIQIGLQHESSGALADAKKWIKDGLVGKVTLLGVFWRQCDRKHGSPDCLDHDGARSALAERRLHVRRGILGKRWPRSAGHDCGDTGFPQRYRRYLAIHFQQ